ncbi:MAG: hypothetical protein UW70_C0027G0004 [Candidatus Peregrinibacteria bacterium GW2011_GWA2_44_7]|nr:MAG: hypothetical protein UW70_C0027G0004 [Candidatus Peregrinibacteria bacterium GW2011_GWA2_44_7]
MFFKNQKQRNLFLGGLAILVVVAFAVGGNLVNLKGAAVVTTVNENGEAEGSSDGGGGGGGGSSGGGTTTPTTPTVTAGTLQFSASSTPVGDDIVAGGATGVLVARYQAKGTGEAFTVTKLSVRNDSAEDNTMETNKAAKTLTLKYPTSVSAPTTLNGIATASLKDGKATFENLTMMVPNGGTAQMELYVDLFNISQGTSSANANTRQLPEEVVAGNSIEIIGGKQIELDFDYDSTFEAVGQTSKTVISQTKQSTGDIDANEIAIYKSIPGFAKDTAGTSPCASGKLVASGEAAVYCLAITASGNGDVGLYKLSFEIAAIGLDEAALSAANAVKVYRYESNGTVGTTALATGTWASKVANVIFTAEEVVAKGSTQYYVVKVPVTLKGGEKQKNGSVTTRLGAESVTVHSASTNAFGVVGRNVWSDRSAKSHSTSTSDWTNGYKVKGLPTEATSMKL